eukprot:547968-Rhodomonas_salina.1
MLLQTFEKRARARPACVRCGAGAAGGEEPRSLSPRLPLRAEEACLVPACPISVPDIASDDTGGKGTRDQQLGNALDLVAQYAYVSTL